MPIKILMPALSPTMTEGTLARWLKTEGDKISPGDILAEIETDKATMEVEAIDEGTLAKIFIPEGSENVPVNTLIAALLEEGEDEASLEAFQAGTATAPSSSSSPQNLPSPTAEESPLSPPSSTAEKEDLLGSRVIASPLAKRIASKNQVELRRLTGSGPRGRIIKADVEAFLKAPPASRKESPLTGPVSLGDGPSSYETVKLSTMRKVIARRLTESKTTVPHFYLSLDCQIDALLKCRQDINRSLDESKRISVNDFILKAVAKSLKDVPDANTSYADDHIKRYHHADISVAVAIEGGLVTPVVRRAETLSLLELSQEVKDLIKRARAGTLMPEDYQGGTFSVSNLGMYGIKSFSAIINPPQGCILAIGAGESRPIVVDGQIAPATLMNCTLSVDHRVIDGAVGASFFQAFKRYIENPLLLLI